MMPSATATDLVTESADLELSNDAPSVFMIGDTLVTWTATDTAGNAGSATATVTVEDTTPPVITAPAAVIVEAIGPTTAVALGTATAGDTAGGVTISNNAPSLFNVESVTEVTWTATDDAGNAATATQQVTVLKLDTDEDGVCDPGGVAGTYTNCSGVDNCPAIPNSTQSNFDGDEFGDACDADIDGDTVYNEMDYCPLTDIPESVPSRRLLSSRYALMAGSQFTSTSGQTYTTADTGGCSCEQVLSQLGIRSVSENRYGCRITTLRRWQEAMNDSGDDDDDNEDEDGVESDET